VGLHRRYALASGVWTGAYAVRALVTGSLYRADEASLLAAAKMGLGWPLSVACLLATLAILRGSSPATAADQAARSLAGGGSTWASRM